MSAQQRPAVEVTSCHSCPCSAVVPRGYRCRLAGVVVGYTYGRVPDGCPLRGGPVEIKLGAGGARDA